jgi:hypothetical protein
VRVNGLLVGYLSRDDAALYRPGLLKLTEKSTNNLVALHAVVVGGGERPDGLGRLGVFIDHDPADFGLAPHQVVSGQNRTGLSRALASDLDDDQMAKRGRSTPSPSPRSRRRALMTVW